MPTTTTTTRTYVHTEPAMCFRAEPKKYYYHQEYIPVRQVHHPHHHGHHHGHHHHHHHHSTSPVPRASYNSVRHSHSPRVSTSSHHRSGPVVYQSTSKTRYYN